MPKRNERKGLRSLVHTHLNDTKGARYDFLGSYENEAVTVFDDLKPNTFSYTEFLNLWILAVLVSTEPNGR